MITNKFISTIAAFGLTIVSWGLQAQSLDKVVAVVGNEPILQSDIEMTLKELRIMGQLPDDFSECDILKMLADQKMLVAQAKLDSLDVNTEHIETQVDRRIAATQAQLGSKEMLEIYYRKKVEKLRQEIIESQIQQAYAQAEQAEIVKKVKITPSEVERFFKSIPKDSLPTIPDQYVLCQIVKKPDSESAVIEVKERLLDIRRRILNGEKFQTLAMLYSEDPGSARRGGELGLSEIESYVPSIRNALNNMRPNQISQIIESEYGYHILQMIEKQPENGLVNYRHILVKPKYTTEDRSKGFAKLDSIANLIKKDSITFEKAALFFSDDEKTRYGNGVLVHTDYQTGEMTSYFYKDQLRPNDYKAIEHLGVNEISEPFESVDDAGNVVYKIIMIKSFVPAHTANVKDDFIQIARLLENKKQNEVLQEWIGKKIKTEYIRISKEYESCSFVDPSWLF